MRIKFRNMKYSDLSQVIDINMRNLPENYKREFWEQEFQKNKQSCFVALNNSNTIIGYIFYSNEMLFSIAIEKEYRNKTIGKYLLKLMINSLKSENPLSLYVRTSNKHAIHLYKSFGFKIVDEELAYYKKPTENAFIMKANNLNEKNIKYDMKLDIEI